MSTMTRLMTVARTGRLIEISERIIAALLSELLRDAQLLAAGAPGAAGAAPGTTGGTLGGKAITDTGAPSFSFIWPSVMTMSLAARPFRISTDPGARLPMA